MRTLLIVGGCGSGKTWVVAELIVRLKLNILGRLGLFLFHRNDKIAALGKYDGTVFQGSDKLSMAVMGDCDYFLANCKQKLIVCEGDRFTNKTFIEKFKPHIVKITNDGAAGRKLRKSNQSERQIKAKATQVENINADHLVENSTQALKYAMQWIAKGGK